LQNGGRVVLGIVVVLSAVAVALLGLRLYLGRAAEKSLAPDEMVDFASRASVGRANVFAMCPADFCTPQAELTSPVFAMGWQRLHDYWRAVIATQPRVQQLAWDPERRRATYIQRSAVFGFPDIVTVEFVPLGETSASLAIDSRSRYGKSDLGVNRARIVAWMEHLRSLAREEAR
jgi:uncharacterized protein (DUF1499 family)